MIMHLDHDYASALCNMHLDQATCTLIMIMHLDHDHAPASCNMHLDHATCMTGNDSTFVMLSAPAFRALLLQSLWGHGEGLC